jgi:hypothetical protein
MGPRAASRKWRLRRSDAIFQDLLILENRLSATAAAWAELRLPDDRPMTARAINTPRTTSEGETIRKVRMAAVRSFMLRVVHPLQIGEQSRPGRISAKLASRDGTGAGQVAAGAAASRATRYNGRYGPECPISSLLGLEAGTVAHGARAPSAPVKPVLGRKRKRLRGNKARVGRLGTGTVPVAPVTNVRRRVAGVARCRSTG